LWVAAELVELEVTLVPAVVVAPAQW